MQPPGGVPLIEYQLIVHETIAIISDRLQLIRLRRQLPYYQIVFN